jgi:hypothetical protein
LANEALNILWAADLNGNIIQYVLGPADGWKVQAKYSDLGIGFTQCLLRFGNLLFAGGRESKLCVINTADKKVLPIQIETAIKDICSLQIHKVSPSEFYLTVTGGEPSYSENKTDLFNVSNFQQLTFAEKIFSKPELHFKSIDHQFNNDSKLNNPVNEKH